MRLPLLTIVILCGLSVFAQSQKTNYWKIGITNSQTARPFAKFSALFYSPIHPGFELGYMKSQRVGKHGEWQLEPAISYTYHRWVQHNISIAFNEYYRHCLPAGFNISGRLGAGYQLSIPTSKVYELSGETIKAKKFSGRSQFIINAAIGADKRINKQGLMVGLLYQQKIQTPFVKNYVSLLPYNSMMISLTIPIQHKKSASL
jgi:hypothetical protein